MNKIRAILVDDEESARDVLENLLLRFCPEVELCGKCKNVPEAVEMIRQMQPDLVFLDIEMPNYAGYEIVNFFDSVPFEIIFITAYDKYAVRAFEISAVDYLLKPVDIERLQVSVRRVANQLDRKQSSERFSMLSQVLETKELKNIMVSEKGYQQIVPIVSIIAIEAQESYCYIHTAARKYMVSKNLKHFEILFDSLPDLIRVHKSWIIHKIHIANYSKSELTIHLTGGLIAKLSKYKKTEFEESILS